MKLTKDYLDAFAKSCNTAVEFIGDLPDIRTLGYIMPHQTSAGKLAFLADESFCDALQKDQAVVAVITTQAIYKSKKSDLDNYFLMLVEDPTIFFKLHNTLGHETDFYKRTPHANAGERKNCQVAASAVIADSVVMGKNCRIGANAVIKDNVVLGDDIDIGAGAVIGDDSFEAHEIDGKLCNLFHDAGVQIGSGSHIGANCTINAGIFGSDTVIGEQCIIDNNVCIEHCNQLGKQVKLTAGVVIGGSCTIGNNVYMGMRSVVKNSLSIGENSFVSIGAIVAKDVPANTQVIAAPAHYFPIKTES